MNDSEIIRSTMNDVINDTIRANEFSMNNLIYINNNTIKNEFNQPKKSDSEKVLIIKKIIEDHFIIDATIRQIFITIQSYSNNKFECLNSVLSNMFISDENKITIMDTFCKIQRFIHGVMRLKHIWRFKKSNIYNTDDLYLNPIHAGDKNTLVLFCNNTRYVFHIRELIGAINTSLSNASHFFAEPIVCKNPYTNLPFNKSALYNIYFAIRESTFIMPTLFHIYFLSDFNLSHFSMNNEQMVNEEYLRTYVQNNCTQNIFNHISEMCMDHKIHINIHKNFPKDKLFTIMKPYLEMYYMSAYSMNESKKSYHYRVLHRKLHEFVKYNPTFGRRKVRMTQINPFSKSRKIEYYFSDLCPPFYNVGNFAVSTKLFMNSHLCKHDYYNVRHGFNISRMNVNTVRRQMAVNSQAPSDEDTHVDGSEFDNDSDEEVDSDSEIDSDDEIDHQIQNAMNNENEVIYQDESEDESEGEEESVDESLD